MYLFKLQGHTFYFPTRFTSDSEADKLNRIKYCKLFKNFWKELNKIETFDSLTFDKKEQLIRSMICHAEFSPSEGDGLK